MTPDEARQELVAMMPDALKALRACLRPGGGGRNAMVNLSAAKEVLKAVLGPDLIAIDTSDSDAPKIPVIRVEIVRPLALTDGQNTREARIPARVIDAA